MKAIGSHNALAATRRAYELLASSQSPLEAAVAGVTLVEDDPEELSVGYGGLPNEEGIVELDAAVMDGPRHRAGGVAGLRGIRHPSRVAQKLIEQTDRVLVVGEGALKFALANGFVEENLLTDKSRRFWLHWKRILSPHDDWLPPADADPEIKAWFEKHYFRSTGTVHVSAMDAASNISCVTSTSGHAFKMPGRVGDSPIAGAGLYVDNEVGSCGSLGWGEANLQNLSSFAAVELMRDGKSPAEAGLAVLQRVLQHTPARLKDEQGRPKFNLMLYLLAKDGRHAGVTLWAPYQIAVSDQRGTRLEDCEAMYHRER